MAAKACVLHCWNYQDGEYGCKIGEREQYKGRITGKPKTCPYFKDRNPKPLTLTHDDISRFFSEEYVKKAFQFPNWPAGTEIVCYCRSTDSRDAIEQIAQQRQWKIVKYVHIDELPIAKLYKPGQVMFAIREVLEWKRDPTMQTYEEWCNQMLGGLRLSDWDKFKINY